MLRVRSIVTIQLHHRYDADHRPRRVGEQRGRATVIHKVKYKKQVPTTEGKGWYKIRIWKYSLVSISHPTAGPSQSLQDKKKFIVNVHHKPSFYLLLVDLLLLEDPVRRGITSCCDLTSKVTGNEWYCCRSYASCIAIPAVSLGNQMIGGGAINSGAYRIPAISSAWSVNGKGGM